MNVMNIKVSKYSKVVNWKRLEKRQVFFSVLKLKAALAWQLAGRDEKLFYHQEKKETFPNFEERSLTVCIFAFVFC